MHYKTRNLHRSQRLVIAPEGENRIRCELYEEGAIKFSRALSFPGRGQRARALAFFNDAWETGKFALESGADPEAAAEIFRFILNS